MAVSCNHSLPHLSHLQVTLQPHAFPAERNSILQVSFWGFMTPLLGEVPLNLWFLFSGNMGKKGEIICCLKGT